MLVHSLRQRLGDPTAASFQLVGDDLALLSGVQLREAAEAYEHALALAVPEALRPAFEQEQAAVLAEVHTFLRRHNRSLRRRIRGYLELGKRMQFKYPWPVVAILGLCQVLDAMNQSRAYGLVGEVAQRVGVSAFAELASNLDDILLRTNRAIFADSIPIVLYAWRCHSLRQQGQRELAEALLAGPLPILFDEDSRMVCSALVEGLDEPDPEKRFRTLAKLTLVQFGREQRIFSYHLGRDSGRRAGLLAKLGQMRQVPAPVVVEERGERKVVFRAFKLPSNFEMRDHDARVKWFGQAFVMAVTNNLADYQAAKEYVEHRFG